MSSADTNIRDRQPAGELGRDRFVVLTIVLVSVAATLGLFAHLETGLVAALFSGALLFVALAATHVAHRRGTLIGRMIGEIDRLRAANQAAMGRPERGVEVTADVSIRTPQRRTSAGEQAQHAHGKAGALRSPVAAGAAGRYAPVDMGAAIADTMPGDARARAAATSKAPSTAVEQPRPEADLDAMWEHRPGTQREPVLGTGVLMTALPEEIADPTPTAGPERLVSPQDDVGTIQALIKRLAEDLNAPRRPDPPELRGGGLATQMDAGYGAPTPDARLPTVSRQLETDKIARSVEALRATAGIMRGASTAEVAAPTAASFVPAPAAQSTGWSDVDEQIAVAVAEERFTVYVEPIHGLSDRRARHFEVSVRVQLPSGQELDPADYHRASIDQQTLTRIDAAKLLRTAKLAERLLAKGKSASVQSSIGAQSIADDIFIDELAQNVGGRDELARQLVLCFSQADVRAFTAVHWEALRVMASLGLRFALEEVVDLDIDFEALRAYGFVFVKLDAEVLCDGMPANGATVLPADLCRYLASIGLGVIVRKIEDENLLARVLGFGVLLGQGTLFGGARAVRVEDHSIRHASREAAA